MTENPAIRQMILFAEYVLIVFYVFQIVRSFVNDDNLFALARKCFQFLVILLILGQAPIIQRKSLNVCDQHLAKNW